MGTRHTATCRVAASKNKAVSITYTRPSTARACHDQNEALAPPPPDDDHDCGWKVYAKAQDEKLAEITAKLAELERRFLGKKSERRKPSKLPPPLPTTSDPAEARKKRDEARAMRDAKLETEEVAVPVSPDQCTCPECGNTKLRRVGKGKSSTLYEYVQPHFRRRIYHRETLACRCGHIITAPAPDRVGEKTRYAASFIAHLIVNKCSESTPQYRLEKFYKNIGIPVSRSTMCELLHRGADVLRPLHTAALALVPAAPDVHADETSMRQQDIERRSFIWSFVTRELVVYRYALSRSGDVPKEVLGQSQGRLVVDQHTGYNAVTKPGGRVRAGCIAHARRKIFEQSEHPETKEALDLISAIYRVEGDAKNAAIAGTDAHLALRREHSRPLFAKLLRWGHRHRRSFEPRSGMGRAIRYLLRNFRELGRFLRYASIPPDNNIAEASLRRVALGRANFLFVGHEDAGKNFAVLYTLVATCEKHGVNAIAYLTDVLTRVQDFPADRIAELLPHRWRPP
jgi:transposase